MNNATFAGRIGRDAELRSTRDGKSVANFSLAVDEYAGQNERKTLWVDCSMWGERAAKLAQYLTKGTPVAVSGQVGIRTYESNGETRAALTLRVSEVTLLGGRADGNDREGERTRQQNTQRQQRTQETRQAPPADDFEDDIPF